MASARKIADETEARRCLRAARLAGLSAGEWARARGIDGRSLNAWRMNLAGHECEAGVWLTCSPTSGSFHDPETFMDAVFE